MSDNKEIFNDVTGTDFKQSANTLFKFMKKLDYLKTIIKNSAIIPRYNTEIIEYLNIKMFSEIAYPMVCFCDINLTKLHHHTKNYGSYGIGFKKQYTYSYNDIEPIHYVNPISNEIKDFKSAFSVALNNKENNNEILKNYLSTTLLFMKPIEGDMYITDEKTGGKKREFRRFHDEKEWRYVPHIQKEDLYLVLHGKKLTDSFINECNKVLENQRKYWLKFPISEVNYLMVETENDSIELANYIFKLKKYTKDEKRLLVSKIIILKNLEKDW